MNTSGTTDSPPPSAISNNSTIAVYRASYADADQLSREVSNFRDDVAIPANNELRYAGYHLLQAIGDDGSI